MDGYQVIHILFYIPFPDPCKTEGCNAPYNIGCRVVNNKAQCICPTCPNILKPVCASDHVQDLSECHMKRQACELNIDVAVEKRAPCGTLGFFELISYTFFVNYVKGCLIFKRLSCSLFDMTYRTVILFYSWVFFSIFCSFLLKEVTSDVILFLCLVVYFVGAWVRFPLRPLLIVLLGFWLISVRDASPALVGGVSRTRLSRWCLHCKTVAIGRSRKAIPESLHF